MRPAGFQGRFQYEYLLSELWQPVLLGLCLHYLWLGLGVVGLQDLGCARPLQVSWVVDSLSRLCIVSMLSSVLSCLVVDPWVRCSAIGVWVHGTWFEKSPRLALPHCSGLFEVFWLGWPVYLWTKVGNHTWGLGDRWHCMQDAILPNPVHGQSFRVIAVLWGSLEPCSIWHLCSVTKRVWCQRRTPDISAC